MRYISMIENELSKIYTKYLEQDSKGNFYMPDTAPEEARSAYERRRNMRFELEMRIEMGGWFDLREEFVVRIKKFELSDSIASYEYFPDESDESGVVSLKRDTKEHILEWPAPEYSNAYAEHALSRMEEYQDSGKFLEEDVIGWHE